MEEAQTPPVAELKTEQSESSNVPKNGLEAATEGETAVGDKATPIDQSNTPLESHAASVNT
jgi:hypothetical protein